MYGHLNIVLKHYMIEKFGEEKWHALLEKVKHSGEFSETDKYDDRITSGLIDHGSRIVELQRDAFMQLLGEYFLDYLRNNYYDEIIRNVGANVLDFIQNLDWVQTYLSDEYQDVILPSFRCDEDSVSDRMVLHYYSYRPGYTAFVRGFITYAAKSLYQMELSISQISATVESVNAEKGFREHIIMSIIAKKIAVTYDEGPPTFVAQTKKHGERQISKKDVEAVRIKLEQIRLQYGDQALPVAKYRSARAKWKAIAKLTLLGRGFVPTYPQQIAINSRSFIDIFPYHIVVDSDMKVYQSGIQIQRMMPSIRSRMAHIADFFTMRYPKFTDFTFDNIKRFIMSPYVLEMKKERLAKDFINHHPFALKGQMFVLMDKNYLFFICSPLVRSWYDLEQHKMKLAEIPLWDATRDFLLSELCYRIMNVHSGFMKQMTTERQRVLMLGPGEGSLNERLVWLKKELEKERSRNDMLHHAYLPRPIAEMVRHEYHSEVTAMFCDIVHFIQMVAACKPSEIVALLNSLFTRFDRVTKVHDTFKVETIGDAYFVVSGMPEKVPNHADRIANTALGMMILAHDVISPLNGERVLIRIGIHTGSMVSGVVGSTFPRYTVFGETAVVASKMESHGEPGRIHISPSTYIMLRGKGFMIQERGKIELRGFGSIGTYFLVGNENATEDELVGRSRRGLSFVSERSGTLDRKNKKKLLGRKNSTGVGSRQLTGDSEFVTFSY